MNAAELSNRNENESEVSTCYIPGHGGFSRSSGCSRIESAMLLKILKKERKKNRKYLGEKKRKGEEMTTNKSQKEKKEKTVR